MNAEKIATNAQDKPRGKVINSIELNEDEIKEIMKLCKSNWFGRTWDQRSIKLKKPFDKTTNGLVDIIIKH